MMEEEMPRPCSRDLRERVVRCVERGLSRRAAAALFEVSPSSAVKWVQQYRATGRLEAKPMGAPRRSKLDAHEALLLQLIEERPDMTLSEMGARLGESGVKVTIDTISRFFKRRGITSKKNRARQRARARGRRPGTGAVAAGAGQA